MVPLAERLRPHSLDEMVGQTHLFGAGKPMRRIIESGQIPNMIFYGPSGVGKTTLARMIADRSDLTLHKLNGTTASISEIRDALQDSGSLFGSNGVLLYLDEIQYLNKKQQQSLLEYIENGSVTLIASTTENPYFAVFNAIISRATVFEFKPVSKEEILPAIRRAYDFLAEEQGIRIECDASVMQFIAAGCGGDVRKAVNTVELSVLAAERAGDCAKIDMDAVQGLTQRSNMRYDKDGDQHYDLLSALHKSIRGSDENAAIHYAARIMETGDLLPLCRRLLCIASEDVGLAYPLAIPIVKAAVDTALQLGMPEARLPLSDAVILLATSPKSNSAYLAADAAFADIRAGLSGDFPRALQNVHFDGADAAVRGQHYLYPHDYPNHWVPQQYLPDTLKDRVYYHPADNRQEQAAKEYWDKIKAQSAASQSGQSGRR
ncbi:MAG: replication-associated recombination protein A [Oscillospiraceae bacterium]|nr:replication-associated recombination protein A [Oscillospiraceae bacterium]